MFSISSSAAAAPRRIMPVQPTPERTVHLPESLDAGAALRDRAALLLRSDHIASTLARHRLPSLHLEAVPGARTVADAHTALMQPMALHPGHYAARNALADYMISAGTLMIISHVTGLAELAARDMRVAHTRFIASIARLDHASPTPARISAWLRRFGQPRTARECAALLLFRAIASRTTAARPIAPAMQASDAAVTLGALPDVAAASLHHEAFIEAFRTKRALAALSQSLARA